MYSRGHIGLTFLILSFLLKTLGLNDRTLSISLFAIIFSTFPDLDLKISWRHRDLTHSFIFSLLISLIFSIILYKLSGDFQLFICSFLGSFTGMSSHILGDLFTLMKFKPFWPFSKKEIALGLFRSDNRLVNESLFIAGIFLFFFELMRLQGFSIPGSG